MPKLNQIIAIEADAKKHSVEAVATVVTVFGKPKLFSGLSRTYKPKDDEGEKLPDEKTEVQFRVDALLNQLTEALTRTMDLTATKDYANGEAKADVVVDGKVLLKDVPSVTLLFLERQLKELESVVKLTPILDMSESWGPKPDPLDGLYKTMPSTSHKTAKVVEPLVLYPHTEKHPAQTEKVTKDVTVGYYRKTELSGAWPITQVDAVIGRIRKLLAAVKSAREEANGTPVIDQHVGAEIFKFIFD